MYEIYERLLALHGVTSADVCRDTGISQSTISTWKTRRTTISTKNAKKIADYFGVPVDVLMGNADVRLDSETVLSDEKAFSSYLKNLGWDTSIVHDLRSGEYYNLNNGQISVNVSAKKYAEFENKIRNECVDWILGMVSDSLSVLAARQTSASSKGSENDINLLKK